MKKILIIGIVLFTAFAFIRIATSTYENMRREKDADIVLKTQKITAKEAEDLCYTVMGKQDEATGFPFSFITTGTVERDGKEYYSIRASWLVNNSNMSYIGDFFVSVLSEEIYTGFVQGTEYTFEDLIWSK